MSTRPGPPRTSPASSPSRKRRWWPWLLLAPVVLATAAVLAAPWLACRAIAGRTPFPAGDLVVTGCRLGGQPPSAMVVATCDPATFRAVCEGASGRWLPPILLADGQHAWGTFADAPEVSWRLDLDRDARVPRVEARIPQPLAERLLAARLAEDQAPVSRVRIGACALTGEPTDGVETVWDLRLAGSAAIAWGDQILPLAIEDLHLSGTSRLQDAEGGRRVSAELRVRELRGTAPLLGPLAPLAPIVEKQANQRLRQELPKALVPQWWPSAMRWDLRTVPGATAEF